MKTRLLLLLGLFFGSSAFAEWTTVTIDSLGDVGTYSSIALDANNNPHIAYYDYTNNNLKYAKWTGSSWSIQTVDSTGYVGTYTSIAIDSANNPHISYYGGGLKYAKWTGSAWSIQMVDSLGGSYNAIAVDSYDNPHISYKGGYNDIQKYAKWTGSAWLVQSIASTWNTATSIAIDSSNNPHISYFYNSLQYAKWTGSTWLIGGESGSNAGAYTSIAVDSLDNTHISYDLASYGGGGLKYAKCAGSSCSLQIVDPTWGVGAHNSIAVDSSNNPHISYYESSDVNYNTLRNLKYAKWTGSSWSFQTVDATGDVGTYCSIALDTRGNPNMSYYDATNYNLKYAKVAITNSLPALSWTGAADYSVDGVNPEIGDKNTPFVFRVKYSDANNDAPVAGYPKIHILKGGSEISGSPFSMSYVSGAHSTGSIYSLSKTLANGLDYSYYFEARDVFGGVAASFPSVAKTGPGVYKALVYWTGESDYTADGLSPESGDRYASYSYRLKFSDSDNAVPATGFPKVHIRQGGVEVSGSPFTMAYVSGTHTTGAIYSYTKTLLPGANYTYYFEAQDAVSAVAGGSPTAETDAPDVSNLLQSLSWTGELNYSDAGVYPRSASSDVLSVFRVKYSDAENDAPAAGYPKLYVKKGAMQIAGSPFLMSCSGAGYVSGVICVSSRVLGSGDYSYRFEVLDAYDGLALGTPANENGGLVSIGTDLPAAQEVKIYHGVFKPGQNEKTNVSFNTAAPVSITVTVYNNIGRKVKELYRGSSSSGLNLIQWDGRDDGGQRVSSGVYTIKIEGGGINQSKRVVVVR